MLFCSLSVFCFVCMMCVACFVVRCFVLFSFVFNDVLHACVFVV